MKYSSYGRRYESTPKRVRFIPVKHGDMLDLGNTGMPGVSGAHKIIGFKAATGKTLAGWLVVLVDEAESAAPRKRRLQVAS